MILGILGFLNNPIIGSNAAIEADLAQNIGHLVLGAFLIGNSFTSESGAAFSLYLAAIVTMVFAGLVYMEGGSYSRSMLWNVTWINRTSSYFHAALAFAMALAGKMNTARRQLFY